MNVVAFVGYDLAIALSIAAIVLHVVVMRRDRRRLGGAHDRLGTLACIVRLDVPSRREIKRRRDRAKRLGLEVVGEVSPRIEACRDAWRRS